VENRAGHCHPLVTIVVQGCTVDRGFAATAKQGNIKIMKEKVRVNYALKAATRQGQVELVAHRARHVRLGNTTVQRVARRMSV